MRSPVYSNDTVNVAYRNDAFPSQFLQAREPDFQTKPKNPAADSRPEDEPLPTLVHLLKDNYIELVRQHKSLATFVVSWTLGSIIVICLTYTIEKYLSAPSHWLDDEVTPSYLDQLLSDLTVNGHVLIGLRTTAGIAMIMLSVMYTDANRVLSFQLDARYTPQKVKNGSIAIKGSPRGWGSANKPPIFFFSTKLFTRGGFQSLTLRQREFIANATIRGLLATLTFILLQSLPQTLYNYTLLLSIAATAGLLLGFIIGSAIERPANTNAELMRASRVVTNHVDTCLYATKDTEMQTNLRQIQLYATSGIMSIALIFVGMVKMITNNNQQPQYINSYSYSYSSRRHIEYVKFTVPFPLWDVVFSVVIMPSLSNLVAKSLRRDDVLWYEAIHQTKGYFNKLRLQFSLFCNQDITVKVTPEVAEWIYCGDGAFVKEGEEGFTNTDIKRHRTVYGVINRLIGMLFVMVMLAAAKLLPDLLQTREGDIVYSDEPSILKALMFCYVCTFILPFRAYAFEPLFTLGWGLKKRDMTIITPLPVERYGVALRHTEDPSIEMIDQNRLSNVVFRGSEA
ncbi:hypothetical protein HDU96_008225 [Phlyctochytrium bullatum]|nr:hypothetical protein HDU96_008225 [Phlyctochytrium bullatum]